MLAEIAEIPEPDGPGEVVRVLACGLRGSDLEKMLPARAILTGILGVVVIALLYRVRSGQ